MTCYLRMHEVAVAVRAELATTDWVEVGRLWRGASGVDGRDDALAAMPVDLVEMDDLPGAGLDGWAGLILSGRADQHLLAGMAGRLAELLGRGGTVVFSGQLTAGWLPGATPFERTGAPREVGPPQLTGHPVLAGVDPDELGGSFLYANGWHRPPEHAEVIARRADGTPGAYVDRESTPGTVLLHGGANLLAHGTTDGTAARIVPQLIEWVAAGAPR